MTYILFLTCFLYSILYLSSSTNLDGWNDYQIRMMKNSGNKAASTALKVPIGAGTGGSASAKEKYSSRLAVEYKQRLQKIVEQEIRE